MIRQYLNDMINDHKTRREWKQKRMVNNQLTMQINFISSKDSEETRTIHTKSHNIEIMMGNKTDEIIKKHFESLLQNYQKDLKETMIPQNLFLKYKLVHYMNDERYHCSITLKSGCIKGTLKRYRPKQATK